MERMQVKYTQTSNMHFNQHHQQTKTLPDWSIIALHYLISLYSRGCANELSQEDLVLVEDFLAEADFFHEINRLDLDDTMDLLVLLEPIP